MAMKWQQLIFLDLHPSMARSLKKEGLKHLERLVLVPLLWLILFTNKYDDSSGLHLDDLMVVIPMSMCLNLRRVVISNI